MGAVARRSFGAAIISAGLLLLAQCLAPSGETAAPDCMIDAGPCIRTSDGMTVTFDLNPKPVRAMRELQFSVHLAAGGSPIEQAKVAVDLTMPGMQMGENVIPLAARGGGRYAGTGVIVRCPSGKKLWSAGVTVRRPGTVTTVRYLFEAP